MKWFKLIPALPFHMVFEGTDPVLDPVVDPPVDPPATEPPAKGKVKPKFDPVQQEYFNSVVAEERRKLTAKNDQLITQLETQKNLTSTTAAERQTLEEKIADLKAEFQTKEQLSGAANEKTIKQLQAEVKKKDAEAITWRERHHKTLVDNSLTEAAVKGKAYNAKQVVTILRPLTRVVELANDKGEPTGEFETRVKLQTKDKEGQPVVLDLDPIQAVKQLAEMGEEYDNLFISPATGGLGSANRGNAGNGGVVDRSKLSTEDYISQRKKDKDAASDRRRASR